ncbi:midasin-like [Sipha flava]|uniref:Midasin n=1 Tax=Sipha flava TaxID=143950 RepID=A0A8B8FBI8_9HEMI|nr:midasin-like [Sipha flava]
MDSEKPDVMSANELRVILDYYSQYPPPWIDNSKSSAKKRKMENNDIRIVEDVLRALNLAAEHFRNLWDWSEFANMYLNNDNTYVVWLACQCNAIILQLTESEKNALVNLYMDQKTNDEHMLTYNLKSHLDQKDYLKSYIASQYITVEEVFLPIVGASKQLNDLILVNSTKQNLQKLSLAVSAGKVASLVGPVGSGKSALVHYLANVTGHTDEKLLTVQLGDETDSKMMLGSYHCTDIPGEFAWQPGALTKAVTEGKWLLLEDIDSASSDLAAVLVSLIESRTLTVPGFRDRIIPATGFQLFFTQRVVSTTSGYYSKQNIATDLLGKHYIQVNVEPLSKEELIKVIEIKFPVLKTIAPKIVDVFFLFSAGFHNDIILNLKSSGRLTSTRDLMKWCSRIVKEYDVTSSESALKVIQDAIDIFCCSERDSKTRLELARHVASLIGVVKTKAEFFLNEYKPTIILDEKHCIAGRVTLPRTGSFLTENYLSNSVFAFTRSSCCLLERIASAIDTQESVLLVGETGTGKTSTLQLLAKHTGNKLIVLNMNQQSDSVDLIGGYKPVEFKIIIKPIREEFECLFRAEFDLVENTKFLGHISTCFNNREWTKLIKLIKHVVEKAIKKNTRTNKPIKHWLNLNEKLSRFEIQLKHCQTSMAFAFVEGSLIRAVKEGYWVLLDEINLASAETLQCLSSLLESNGTLTIYEKTDSKPIIRHPNFRLMAAMNPATDVGKKDLPSGIRNRFTEFFVDELIERSDLITLTASYLPDYSAKKLNCIAKFYLIAKREAEHNLVDGTGHKPHYSLRTYCRALSIASVNPCQSTQRSLYESFCLSFLTQLDSLSHKLVETLIATTMFGEKLIMGVINQPIPKPIKTEMFVQFEGYWIQKGSLEPSTAENYILTNSVKKNLRDLVRAVSLSCFPVLIQGDTCVGKTSLITYLAAASGNNLVRINNHEHTDLQEYIGSYLAESITGQLVFKEGVLVEAMKKGHWIVLDELNLAPTDVLEALNRVLDDNRELFIPETQTTIKAHPGFRLFATQNPPGLYGGRKILSRAFKNRFIEMHFDEIPANELEIILFKRCEIPSSYAKKIVSVMKELQSTRKGSAAFAGKHGFITLRDLFRWGERYRLANVSNNYDWNQHLADEGFLVLASKVRKIEEEQTILHILEKHFKCSLSLNRLFTLNDSTSVVTRHILQRIQKPPPGFEHIYMSKNLRRMVVLASKSIEFNEPILFVGETGCGKTTVCQMMAALSKKKLLTVNCHQHTESSDFLGGLRPVRNRERENDKRLFEWVDGPLIEALTDGHMFLADEISLADDSVLERFNSLLEPERKILLSEKIGDDNESELVAHPDFCFIGTMNPGGDYGKKELSPALRNRLTEIWCESCTDDDDLVDIINQNFSMFHDHSLYLSQAMVDFVKWLKKTEFIRNYLKLNISIRDYLIWVKFIESMMNQLPSDDINYNNLRTFITLYYEGAQMTFLDKATKIDPLYDHAIECALSDSLKKYLNLETIVLNDKGEIIIDKLVDLFPKKCNTNFFGYDGYHICRGELPEELVPEFSFDAPNTKKNIIRLLRCMQIENRAILLEGSPGVGKTSLVQAIAKVSGHKLTRINLSEQTDVSDLFGADLPTDGGDGGSFEWRDGPFLRALKEGNWILLDELNLASQSVLEGLNAVLDHRGELYIPELGRTFIIESKKTRLFACQNPMSEGGARKGLPKSFLNRFLQVHLNVLDHHTIVSILEKIYGTKLMHSDSLQLDEVVEFTLSHCDKYKTDMNLRDILRWVDVTVKLKCEVSEHFSLIFSDRSPSLKKIHNKLFSEFNTTCEVFNPVYDFIKIFPCATMFNRIIIPRKRAVSMPIDQSNYKLILKSHTHTLNSLAVCMRMNWMPILVGVGCGKTSIVKTFAQLCGHELRILPVNSAMDTIEILGGFEQADFNRHLEEYARKIESAIYFEVGQQLLNKQNDKISLLTLWNEYKKMTDVINNTMTTMASEMTLFKKRIVKLIEISNKLEHFEMSYSLQALSERICSIGSLNSGGKFEWIDSVLVKCLIDGNWLLIDNVNLCSPAVLDRLNGLLEPNGVLEIGEKGIDSEGKITTIKPHKDFRLFLAMDPKHGSISRAMKNRGVEIYMSPLDEINNHDIHSMLEFQGIHDKKIRHILIEFHNVIKDLAIGINFSINHLIRTAYLVSQNLKQGRLVPQTIREMCIDTYVRCLNDNLKQNAISEIDRLLEEHPNISNEFMCPSLNTLDILQSSSLCYIKQECSIIEQYENLENINLEDLLLCYFGRSSKSDITMRSKWLSLHLDSDIEAIKNFIKQPPELEFDMLNFVVKSSDYVDINDLPYDFRYLPNTYYNNGNPICDSTPYAENKIHLMLDHALNRALDKNFATKKMNEKNIMIADGGMLHDYAILSIAFEDFLDYFMGEKSLTIDEFNCLLLKEMIIWTRTIEKILYEKLDKESEYVSVLIYCYFYVIVKHFVPMMQDVTGREERIPYFERLKTMRNQVLKNYLTPNRCEQFIHSFRRNLKIPSYNCCKIHGDANIKAYSLNIDFVTSIKSYNILSVVSCEIKKLRSYLLMVKYNRCESVTDDNEELEKTYMNDMEFNLIPLWEYVIERNFFIRINYSFTKNPIYNKYKSTKLLLQYVPTVSPYYHNSLNNDNEFSVEFLLEGLKHSMNSVAVENPKSFLEWSSKNIEIQNSDEIINKEMLYSFEQPLFTVFITHILLKETESFYTFSPTPIRFIQKSSHNLKCIKSFIWNFSEWNSDNQFENIETLLKLVKLIFSPLLPNDSSLKQLHLKRDDEAIKSSVAAKVNYSENMVKVIFDTAQEIANIKRYLDLHKNEVHSTDFDRTIFKEIQFSAGRLWVLSGMCLLEIFSAISSVDPLQKTKIRIECSEAEKKKLNSRLCAERLFCKANGVSKIFPFKNYYDERLKMLNRKHKNVGYRPDPPMYNFILKEVIRFSKMYGLESNTYNMIDSNNKTDHEALVNEMDNWLNSVSNFHDDLNKHYAAYPDILSGILLSINQMRYGMRMLKNHYKWAINKNENISCNEVELLKLFGKYPRFCPNIIQMTSMDNEVSMNISDKFRWYKLCLEELNNMLYLSGQADGSISGQYISTIEYILEKFINNWKQLQEEEENKKREEDSIYKQKSMCETIPIEIELAQGVARQFPITKHSDFNDIEGPQTLDHDILQNTETIEVYNLNDKDINDICRLHSELIRPAALAHWLPKSSTSIHLTDAKTRLYSSFSDRFCMFGKLLMSKFMYLDHSMDIKMMPWLLVATNVANNPKKLDNKGYYDFYRDSNIDCAKKTYEALKSVENHLITLLCEWPDHPTLQTAMKIVERIMNFDWSSPASRFLIGFELLLSKLHEWEEITHHGMSVRSIILIITRYIQEYRNLELSSWKDCLKTSLKKVQNDSSKWWFHLYSIFQDYLHKQETFQQLVTALQKFMESSSLGQYLARLELLYTFHCDVVCKEKSATQTELCNASWNLYKYYSQFKDCINLHIETLSKDTKKKLADFIKIVKWNDINYWSVKETVTKVQQTLHKYTREYEEILNNSASFAMTIKSSSIIDNKVDPYILPTLELNKYLRNCEVFLNIDSTNANINVLRNINKYSKKLLKLSFKIMIKCSYTSYITDLNDFINGIMESAHELRDIKIDSDLSKEKQKSQAKQILQRKRKALSDLFKVLNRIGLSYKAGLIGCEKMDSSIEFARLPPIDINAALQFLIPECIDDNLRCAWSDCESYFLKSVSQTSALNVASETPKLGQQEMNRIKGFVNDLKNVTWNCKKNLASNIDSLVKFRCMMNLSQKITDSNDVILDPSPELLLPINYIANSLNFLHQLKVAIQDCDENIDFTSNDSVTSLLNSNTQHTSFNDKEPKPSETVNTNLDDFINEGLSELNFIIDKDSTRAMKLCNVNFLLRSNYIKSVFTSNVFMEYISKSNEKTRILSNDDNFNPENRFMDQFVAPYVNEPNFKEINNLINQILKSVEKLYQKNSDPENDNENDKLLKRLIIQPLSSDLEDCNLANITKRLENVLKSLIGNHVLRCCHPLLEQYALLVQYLITQQTMVYRALSKFNYLLSTLFTDLASNGFCIPDELLEGEDGTQNDGKSGMGLTEGEGTKDVSDQIESQDQLEDAKKDYSDQPEQDKDLKEEEKGIEMSDDFDGKLHDMDKDENENSDSNDNDDDDQDKEMGETGDGAETLDEKLWGSDTEDENGDEQENQDLKEEDGQGGDLTGEKEFGAKSDKENAEEQNDKDEIDQKNKNKDINELDENGEEAGEDHSDFHHGDLQPPPEPEPMDLPNDLQLDEGEMNDNDEGEDNPFDIDAMKENMENVENNDDEYNDIPKEDQNNLEDTSDEENDDGNKIDETKDDGNEESDEQSNEDIINNDGGKKDENKTGEEPKEEDTKKDIEEAKPSEDEPSQIETQPSNHNDGGSKDQVCENTDREDKNEKLEENKEEATGPEQQGVGRSQRESKETKEGHSVNEDKGAQSEDPGTRDKKRRMKPGEKDVDRSLAESNGSMKKRLKTTDTQDKKVEDDNENGANENENIDKKKGDLFKHVKNSKEGDTETLDAATNEQLEKRPLPNNDDQMGEDLKEDEVMEIEEEINENETNNGEEVLPEKFKPRKQNNQFLMNDFDNFEEYENKIEEQINVDGEIVLTSTVERGMDTMYHTVELNEGDDKYPIDVKNQKELIQDQMAKWFDNGNEEFQKDEIWNQCMNTTSNLAQELSEQLRLVLEPSKASRLQGDFRTGRRINMRRVIPYIASQFKKDKIWLRRTRPSKRQYQIIMAVDNSSSMMDSHAKVLAFESLALVSKALTLVEAGELGVMSFGQQARIVHPLGEPFTDKTGVRLTYDFTFDEQKTNVGELIELATAVFEDRGRLDSGDRPAQLLVIMSDGRGIKSEGPDVVKNAIRTAKLNGIFIVFIVIDNPVSKESILDIKVPIFENNSVRIESYMDNFPFPFYVILRDVDKLPGVLSDALREWFELVTM